MNIIRYQSPQAKLSDFEGKLLILDFWATWCKPCVEMIPRADSLEKQFAGSAVFLPVTYQSAAEVAAFRDKYARRKALRIHSPEVVADTALAKVFPHNALPRYVWIAPGQDPGRCHQLGPAHRCQYLEDARRPKGPTGSKGG